MVKMDEEQIKKEKKRIEGSTIKSKEGEVRIGTVSPNYAVFSDSSDKYTKGRVSFDNMNFFGIKKIDRDLNGKILVYEDRVKGWFLDFAKMLVKEHDAGFIVMMICTSYLEGNQQFREGKTSKRESSKMLINSLKRIFRVEENPAIILFVEEVRHGLFHDGMTRKNVEINSSTTQPFFISKDKSRISINPRLFLLVIEDDFENYISILKDSKNENERENFEKCWRGMYEE